MIGPKRFLLPGLWGVLANTFVMNFGYSLVGIFIPLYILKISSSLNWVWAFYLIFNAGVVFFTIPGARLVARFGSDRLALAGTLVRALVIVLLILASQQPAFLFLASLLWSLIIPFYWLPFHLSVVGTNHDHRFGRATSQINLASQIASIGGPVLGGFIIAFFGFNVLYAVALFFLLLSGLPLLFDRYEFKFPEISLKEIRRNLSVGQNPRLFLAFLGSGLTNQIYEVAWPLYVFLTIGSFRFLGLITSLGLAASFVLLLLLGKMTDRFGNRLIRWSVGFASATWLARPFSRSATGLFLVDLLYQLFSLFTFLPLDRLTYLTSLENKRLEFFLTRELVLHTGSTLAILALAFIFNSLAGNWFLIFSLGAVGLALVWPVSRLKEKPLTSPAASAILER